MPWWNDVDEDLAGIPHAAVGAVAANDYVAPRYTADLDIAIQTSDHERARRTLREHGYELLGELRMGADPHHSKSRWRTPGDHELDLIALDHRWAARALEEATRNRSANAAGLPVMPLPWLALMEAISARPADTADLQRMLAAAWPQRWEEVHATIARWRPQDLEDVESLRQIGLWERESEDEIP